MSAKSTKTPKVVETFRPMLPPPQYDDARIVRELAAADGRRRKKMKVQESWMEETHLGGKLEDVSGFDTSSAFTHGLGPGNYELARPPSPDFTSPGRAMAPSDLRPESEFNVGEPWVKIGDTSRVPFRSICHLEINYDGGGTAQGTGWLVGPDTVITAGHNVLNSRIGRWARDIRVIPGRNGGVSGPFNESYAVFADALDGWKNGFDPDYDLGMIKIADKRLGSATGWFGYAVFTDQDLDQRPLIQSAGYPTTKLPRFTQWYDAGRAERYSNAFMAYRVDTAEGQSGAPVFFTNGQGQRWVVATHVYGQSTANLGRRITNDTFEMIRTWEAVNN